MRYRVFNYEEFSVPIIFTQWDKDGNVTSYWERDVLGYTQDSMYDVETPHFHRRKNAGEIINNPMQHSIVTKTYTGTASGWNTAGSGLHWTMTGGSYEYFVTTYPIPGFISLPQQKFSDVQSVIQSIKQEALAKIDSGSYAFGEDVAEFKKTVNSLRNIFGEIQVILKNLNRIIEKAISLGKSPWQAFSSAWLRARYEIRPLLISAENIIKIYNEGIENKQRKRASAYHFFNYTHSQEYVTYSGNFTCKWSQQARYSGKISVGVLYLDSGLPHGLLDELGLGIKDLIPTLWAVTKFSFLIDRFINISDTIRGIQNFADPNIELLTGWTVSNSDHSDTRSFIDLEYPGWDYAIDTSCNWVTNHKIRTPFTPSVIDVLPVFHLDTSIETLTDLATIFRPRP